MSCLLRLRKLIPSKSLPVLIKHTKFLDLVRPISTSSKGSDVSSISVETDAKKVTVKKKVRPWRTYGYDHVDQVMDVFYMHTTTFFMYTLLLCGSTFIFLYYPDAADMDWAEREALLEIRRREVLGLPLIDKNFIDPATVRLPPDEELGDDDIII